jgi:hypothetical protein
LDDCGGGIARAGEIVAVDVGETRVARNAKLDDESGEHAEKSRRVEEPKPNEVVEAVRAVW